MKQKIPLFLILTTILLSAQVKFKFVTLAPQSSSWGKCLSSIARDVYQQTQRKIRIYVIYGGGGMDEEEMAKEIKYKRVDGGAFTGNGLGHICPEVRVLELPNLFKNNAEIDYVYSKIQKDLQVYFNKHGSHLVGLSETGLAYMFSKKPIYNVGDVRKTKMWMWEGDPLSYSLMKKFKINAKSIKFTAVISSFQTGMIDGFYCTPTAAIQLQWYKQINYMLNFPISDVTGGLVFSKTSWDKLSADQKKIITSVSAKHLALLSKANRKSDIESIALIQKSGVKILKPTQDIKIFNDMSAQTATELTGKLFPAVLLKKIKALLTEYRKNN